MQKVEAFDPETRSADIVASNIDPPYNTGKGFVYPLLARQGLASITVRLLQPIEDGLCGRTELP